jgi:hypothetical protein
MTCLIVRFRDFRILRIEGLGYEKVENICDNLQEAL